MYLKYASPLDAQRCQQTMDGRMFDENKVRVGARREQRARCALLGARVQGRAGRGRVWGGGRSVDTQPRGASGVGGGGGMAASVMTCFSCLQSARMHTYVVSRYQARTLLAHALDSSPSPVLLGLPQVRAVYVSEADFFRAQAGEWLPRVP